MTETKLQNDHSGRQKLSFMRRLGVNNSESTDEDEEEDVEVCVGNKFKVEYKPNQSLNLANNGSRKLLTPRIHI